MTGKIDKNAACTRPPTDDSLPPGTYVGVQGDDWQARALRAERVVGRLLAAIRLLNESRQALVLEHLNESRGSASPVLASESFRDWGPC